MGSKNSVPRRSRGNDIVVIKWRDIPAQVNGRYGEQRHQVMLSRRFQRSIDEAAIVADKKTANEYVGEWQRDPRPFDGDTFESLVASVDAVAAGIEAAFPRKRLQEFVATGGWNPESDNYVTLAKRPEPEIA